MAQLLTNIQSKATILQKCFVQQFSAIETRSKLPSSRPPHTYSLAKMPIDKENILRIICSRPMHQSGKEQILGRKKLADKVKIF